jgi:hypothetical protein
MPYGIVKNQVAMMQAATVAFKIYLAVAVTLQSTRWDLYNVVLNVAF